MSEWKKVKLGDIASAIQTGPFGSQLHQSDYSDVGTPVVMPKDIVCGKIDVSAIARVESHHVERLSRHKINEGDILYARRGDVGKCAYTDKSQTGWLCGTGCLRVTVDKAKAMPEFVFFQLQKKDTVGWVEKHAIGATMLNLNTSILSNVPIELPSLSTQHRIATILSRYDSLIENYQKQIKLLEEAAQRLYKEWFVDLHFPGHENTKIVDGVPEGWEKKKIVDVVVYYDKQRKPLSSMQRMNMEKIYPYYGAAALMDYVDSYLFDGIYLLLGEDGTVITPDNFPVLQYVWGKFWVNNHAHVLRGKDGISTEFLYSMFKEMPIADVVTGAAQPKISQGRLSDKKILMPSLKLIQEWSCIAKHYFGRIRMITEQIRLLTEARDRLLPKLMSGEIEI